MESIINKNRKLILLLAILAIVFGATFMVVFFFLNKEDNESTVQNNVNEEITREEAIESITVPAKETSEEKENFSPVPEDVVQSVTAPPVKEKSAPKKEVLDSISAN